MPSSPIGPPIDSFKCEACGGTFTKGWTDEEALAESAALGFGGDLAVICDDCHEQLMAWAKEKGLLPDA